MSNYCSAILWREHITFILHWDDDDIHFVLDQHTELDFYSGSSLKQQSAFRHIIFIPSQKAFALTP